jgi:hypothetical protein
MKKLLAVVMLAGLLAACNRGSTPPINSSTESQDIAEALVSEVDTSVSSLTMTDVSLATLNSELSAQGRFNCVTATGDISDADGDGVPLAATYTYNCTDIQYFGVTANLTGEATIGDPSSDAAVQGFDSVIKDLRLDLSDKNRSFSEKRNGTRRPRLADNVLTLSHDLNTVRETQTNNLDRTVTVDNELELTFTPVSGLVVVLDEPLPSGTVDVSRSFVWNRDVKDGEYNVTTLTPLSYDANCEELPRFTAGVLEVSRVSETKARTFTVTYTGCGVKPTITDVGE